jgi:RHS repeat-associated protein
MKTSPEGTSLYPFGDDYEITNGIVTRYVSVEGLGVIAKRTTGGPAPGTYWLHSDRLGSIQAITSDGSDPTRPAGTIVFRQTYRPYGETLSQTGDHRESRGWIDQRNDFETGLTHLHARHFDPKLGTFLGPDPSDPTRPGVGMSRYIYGLGDPLNGTDRFGLQKDRCEGMIEECRSYAVTIDITAFYGGSFLPAGHPLGIAMDMAWNAPPPGPAPTTGDGNGGSGTATPSPAPAPPPPPPAPNRKPSPKSPPKCSPVTSLNSGDMRSVALTTDSGLPVTSLDNSPVARPAGWDPHFFTARGASAGPAAFVELANFRQGGAWDAQRAGSTSGAVNRSFIDYANISIGLYASAAHIPERLTLGITNTYALFRSRFNEDMDGEYTFIPRRLTDNIHTGYSPQNSGQVCTP